MKRAGVLMVGLVGLGWAPGILAGDAKGRPAGGIASVRVLSEPSSGAAGSGTSARDGSSAAGRADESEQAARSEGAWPKLVEAFARALVDGDGASVERLLAGEREVRRFGHSELEPGAAGLVGRAARSTLVGRHAYVDPPLVMAADVAADFKRATAVPERVRASFIIDNDLEIKRANATAVQWVTEQLELDAKRGVAVGVIVLWAAKPGVTVQREATAGAEAMPEFEPVFVLLRGEERAGKRFGVDRVVYGNPLPADE